LLKANGEDVKAGQELLMHAKSTATMNTYAQDVTELKHKARRPDGHWEAWGRGGIW